MDKKLILDIFKVPSGHYKEEKMRDFLTHYLKKEGINHKVDNSGNVYNIGNKNAPLLSAHMDTVQDETDNDLIDFIKIRGNILTGYGVVGGDDKCGIIIILDLLQSKKEINFIFSTGEESGGSGARHFVEQNNLSHIPYAVVLDRRGSSDILCADNDYGTQRFETVLKTLGKVFQYKPARGLWSDADILSDKLCCTNLSVGYYSAHQKTEFVDLKDLENATNFTWFIIKHVKEKYEKASKAYSYSYDSIGNYNGVYTEEEMGQNWECNSCGQFYADCVFLKSIGINLCPACFADMEEELSIMNCSKELESERELSHFNGI